MFLTGSRQKSMLNPVRSSSTWVDAASLSFCSFPFPFRSILFFFVNASLSILGDLSGLHLPSQISIRLLPAQELHLGFPTLGPLSIIKAGTWEDPDHLGELHHTWRETQRPRVGPWLGTIQL